MSDKYLVDLRTAEQADLERLLKHGKASARKIARAHILLQAAEGGNDEEIAALQPIQHAIPAEGEVPLRVPGLVGKQAAQRRLPPHGAGGTRRRSTTR